MEIGFTSCSALSCIKELLERRLELQEFRRSVMLDVATQSPAISRVVNPERDDRLQADARKSGTTKNRHACNSVDVVQYGLPLLDILVFALAGAAAGMAFDHLRLIVLPVLIATTIAVKLISIADGYSVHALRSFPRQAGILLTAASIWVLVAWTASLTSLEVEPTLIYRLTIAGAGGLAASLLSRAYTLRMLSARARSGRLGRAIGVVGVNETSRSLIGKLRADCPNTARVVGVYGITSGSLPATHAGSLVRGDLASLVRHIGDDLVDLVIIALPRDQHDQVQHVTEALAGCTCDIATFTGMESFWPRQVQLERIGNGLALVVMPRPIAGPGGIHKATFDRISASLLLIALAPAFALIAAAIRLESPGPVFFQQDRCGYKNRHFRILKFRTMYHHLSDSVAERQTARDDERVTRVGRILRRTSMDELPQLINVLRGDMSLVGPRPHAPGTRAGLHRLDEVARDYPLRHRVKPGITGLAQVSGCRGPIRSEDQLLRRVAYDLSYIDGWSLRSDVKILTLTLVKGFVGQNAF
jgi:Undecaprenyl-phosphate glucose phosphotransferase